jgi:hypothetical protein
MKPQLLAREDSVDFGGAREDNESEKPRNNATLIKYWRSTLGEQNKLFQFVDLHCAKPVTATVWVDLKMQPRHGALSGPRDCQ